MVVSKQTIATHDWSRPHENSQYDLGLIDTTPVAVIGAVSREFGLEHFMLFEKSINIPKFKVFLEELRHTGEERFDQALLVFIGLGSGHVDGDGHVEVGLVLFPRLVGQGRVRRLVLDLVEGGR